MKKIFTLICLLFVVVVSVFSLTGCDSSVDSITISSENGPQKVMVLGQELSLASEISVSKDGEVSVINFGTSGVEITGYDKETLGSQTVIVEYKGAKANFDVEVVERLTISGVTTDYFVGETFNSTNGYLKLTSDDGTSTSVAVSDESVDFSGFSSSTPGSNTVTVEYGGYSQDYTVTIHDISDITIKKPLQTIYESYETEFDVSGGYITITNTDGTLEKSITLTLDMISGFDMSVVDSENTEVTQTIIITYLDVTEEFTITLKYSEVSQILDMLEQLEEVDWTGETSPTITTTQGELAVEALELYEGLTSTEKKQISDDDLSKLVYTAADYTYAQWVNGISVYDDIFTFTSAGLYYNLASYAGVKAEYDLLIDEDNSFYDTCDLFEYIYDEFGSYAFGDSTIAEYYSLFIDAATIQSILPNISYMLDTYEALASVPQNWTADGLQAYSLDIVSAYNLFVSSISDGTYNYDLLVSTSLWRANDDYFEIIYQYYYNINSDLETNTEILNMTSYIYPSNIENMYTYLENAYYQYYYISYGYAYDNTIAMYYYYQALEYYYELYNYGSEMEAALYYAIGLDSTLSTIQYYNDYFCGGNLIYSTTYYDFWDTYIESFDGYLEGDYSSVPALLELFLNCSPETQYYLYYSLTPYYGSTITSVFYGTDIQLSNIIYAYFVDGLASYGFTDSEYDIVINVMYALEYYSTYSVYTSRTEDTLTYFTDLMDEIDMLYGFLTTEQQEGFDTYIGVVYDNLKNVYEYQTSTTDVVLGDYSDDIAELEASLTRVLIMYNYISSVDETGYSYSYYQFYAMFISEYETAVSLYYSIIGDENISDDVLNYMLYEMTMFYSDTAADYMLSYNGAIMYLRSTYISILDLEVITDYYSFIDYYATEDMNLYQFIVGSNALLWSYFDGVTFEDGTTFAEYLGFDSLTATYDDVLAAMELYTALEGHERYAYYTLDSYVDMFDATVIAYFTSNLTSTDDLDEDGTIDALAAVNILLYIKDLSAIVDYYGEYAYYTDDDGNYVYYADYIDAYLAEFYTYYNALNEADKALIDGLLGDLIDMIELSAATNDSLE